MIELFNEGTILAIVYTCLVFSDFVQDKEAKNQIGWISIGIILFNMLINILYMLKKTLPMIKDKLGRCLQKCNKDKV